MVFRSPLFDDLEKTKSARLFHWAASSVLLIATFFLPGLALIQSSVAAHAIKNAVVIDLLCLVTLAFNHRGRTRLASVLLIGGLMLRVTINAWHQGGIRSPGMSVYLVLALMAGLLLGARASLLTATAGLIAALGLALAETLGALPRQTIHFDTATVFILECLYMGVAIMLAVLSTQTLRKELEARKKLLYDYGERIKEATALQKTSALLLDQALSIPALLEGLAALLPPAFQFPQITQARLSYGPHAGQTEVFRRTPWILSQDFATQDGVKGSIEVVYTEAMGTESPFLAEERHLLETLARMLRTALERRFADEKIQQQERRFRALVENIGDGISLVDSEGRILYEHTPNGALLGYKDGEQVGEKVLDYIHPEDHGIIATKLKECLDRRGESVAVEPFRFRRKDGGWGWVEGTGKNRLDLPEIGAIVFTYRDVTERQRLQSDLLQAQKLEAMGRLSGGVAHDFNNILTAILGFSEMLKESLASSDPRREDAQQVINASMRAASLTRQLLPSTRKQVLHPATLDLNAIVVDMEKMLRRLINESISLETRLDPSLGGCRADRGQIEQVILNLVVNARDALPKGGRITIATSKVELDSPETKSGGAVAGSFIKMEVIDTGQGMSEETQRRIFEPFFTTKAAGKGTGLGLATVHGIVTQSGGFLKISSAPDRGTTFQVFLPSVALTQEAPPSPSTTPSAGVAREKTVLLLDDDDKIRSVAVRLLSAGGYKAIEAVSSHAALDFLKDKNVAIDLLITDVVMPEIDGFDLAHQALALRPGLRVFFISGYLDREPLPDNLDFKCAYLQKPFTAEGFMTKVREALGS